MENLEKDIEISRLIVKDLQGDISQKEKMILNKWLEENLENREMYNRVRSRSNRDERERVIRKLNKSAAWKRVNLNMKKSKSLVWRRGLKYAAAMVLPLLVAGVCLYLKMNEQEILSVAEVTNVAPGMTKAELVLANGHKVMLGTGSPDSLASEGSVNIVKNGDGVLYVGGDESEELVYNTIRVPRGGEFKVRLQDGTLVYLNSETELRYPVHLGGKERRVYLSGEAYFDVHRDTLKPFVVVMDKNEIRVLGTEFNARFYKDEVNQVTTLVSGKVLLSTGNNKKIELNPNEQGIIDEQGNVEKEHVDVVLYTAWKDGNFVFRKQSLEDMMKIVERWYNLNVIFENEWCKQVCFSGNVERYEDFSKLAEMLEATGSIKFRIKNNNVYITKK